MPSASVTAMRRSEGTYTCAFEIGASLREAMQARTKIAPQIRAATREEIESLQLPPQGRKRRTFVDLR